MKTGLVPGVVNDSHGHWESRSSYPRPLTIFNSKRPEKNRGDRGGIERTWLRPCDKLTTNIAHRIYLRNVRDKQQSAADIQTAKYSTNCTKVCYIIISAHSLDGLSGTVVHTCSAQYSSCTYKQLKTF